MDPTGDLYDLYLEEREDWQNEISKRDDRIKKLEEALQVYTDKSYLEKFIKEVYRYRPDDPDYAHIETSLMGGVTKIAEEALKKEDWRD